MEKGAFVRMCLFHKVRPDSAKKSIYPTALPRLSGSFSRNLRPPLWRPNGGGVGAYAIRAVLVSEKIASKSTANRCLTLHSKKTLMLANCALHGYGKSAPSMLFMSEPLFMAMVNRNQTNKTQEPIPRLQP